MCNAKPVISLLLITIGLNISGSQTAFKNVCSSCYPLFWKNIPIMKMTLAGNGGQTKYIYWFFSSVLPSHDQSSSLFFSRGVGLLQAAQVDQVEANDLGILHGALSNSVYLSMGCILNSHLWALRVIFFPFSSFWYRQGCITKNHLLCHTWDIEFEF